MTLIEAAKNNKITPLMRVISQLEGLPVNIVCKNIASGKIVIPKNKKHNIRKPCGIGEGLRTKINANIGTSTQRARLSDEIKKLKVAIKYGADTVMDLSVGGDIYRIRKEILRHSSIPIGTVPIYQAAVEAQKTKGSFLNMTKNDIFTVLKKQADDGVDFFTVHCGITRKGIEILKKNRRLLDIVSRGGAILASWISSHNQENPLYEHFDDLLDIAYEYDIVLSLGDALRPGSILDATDKAQLYELKVLGELTLRARQRNIQVMVEGPGHLPLNQIVRNIALEKKICHNAPFYVLGPLVTDVASGYDHISSSIGAAIAASSGANFLCSVTPSEHLRLPSIDDVKDGLIAFRIAAHSAEVAKGIPSALKWDRDISQARRKMDWEKQINLSLDPDKAKLLKGSFETHPLDVCTMCGTYCSIKMIDECLRG